MDHNTCPSCNRTSHKDCTSHFGGYYDNLNRLAAPCSRICENKRHPVVSLDVLAAWARQSRRNG